MSQLGTQFAEALATKDFQRAADLLHLTERDGLIDWLHILCSGLRPSAD